MDNSKSLYNRVNEESSVYSNATDAALDHLLMAEAHLFEEFEGRDHKGLLTKIKILRELLLKEISDK